MRLDEAKPSPARWQTLAVLGSLALLVIRLAYVIHAGHCFEDAYINFRSADNWLLHGQPDYNVGSRIMSVADHVEA